jgi:hypothetical protein
MTVQNLKLKIEITSPACPGSGNGVAGLVDTEIEYEVETGLPIIKARTIKGLLAEECANILYCLTRSNNTSLQRLEPAANFIFGSTGSFVENESRVLIGTARLHEDMRTAVKKAIRDDAESNNQNEFKITPTSILDSLTTIRRQTSIDYETGVAETGSLRSIRTLLPGLTFYTQIQFLKPPVEEVYALLAASALGLKNLGLSRNRGVGSCKCGIIDSADRDQTHNYLEQFKKLLTERGS